MTTTTANKALVRRLYEEVFNNRQLHLINELVADNFVDHNPDPGQEPNRAAIAPMIGALYEAFPNLRVEVQHIVAEGDRVGAHLIMTGTHQGSFMGAQATGRDIRCEGFDWARVQNGRIVERWGTFDMVGVMQQIGLAPTPPAAELKKLVTRYYELLDGAKGDLAKLRSELFHPAIVTNFVGHPQLQADSLQAMMSMFYTSFPDLKHEVTEQVCEGDTVFNILKVTGTHKADFAGIKPTNKSCEIQVMTRQRWIDGRLAEQHITPDFASLLVQLGAIELPK